MVQTTLSSQRCIAVDHFKLRHACIMMPHCTAVHLVTAIFDSLSSYIVSGMSAQVGQLHTVATLCVGDASATLVCSSCRDCLNAS
jgi:hypothetical protein